MATLIVTERLLSIEAKGLRTANSYRDYNRKQRLVLPVVFFKFSQSDLSTNQCCKIRCKRVACKGRGFVQRVIFSLKK
jgi:hypothetical protein